MDQCALTGKIWIGIIRLLKVDRIDIPHEGVFGSRPVPHYLK